MFFLVAIQLHFFYFFFKLLLLEVETAFKRFKFPLYVLNYE